MTNRGLTNDEEDTYAEGDGDEGGGEDDGGESDGEPVTEGNGVGRPVGEGVGDADGEGDGEADGEDDGEDDDGAGDDGLGSAVGRPDGLKNDAGDGPCSTAGTVRPECREPECRAAGELEGTDCDELTVGGACVRPGSAPRGVWTCPAGDSRTMPLTRRMTTAEAARSPTEIHAGARDR